MTDNAQRVSGNQTSAPKHYVLTIWRGVEPAVLGPYETDDERAEAAKSAYAEMDQTDSIFWLNATASGEIEVGAYTEAFLAE